MKGRATAHNPTNRFLKDERVKDEWCDAEEDEKVRTRIIDIHPKTIVNKVPSTDVPLNWSANPYQGCEHGCSYCYARPTHEYWGYGAGIDFESIIMVKRNAAELLRQTFNKRSWMGEAIMMSGNTDCYQPIERELGITRSMLKVCLEHRNPVGIITKNSLILRDIDLLSEMAAMGLAHVNISLNSLDEELRRRMEPRTATVAQRLRTIEALTNAGIPVHVLMAPVVPGLNAHEMFDLVETVAQHGAYDVGYILIRLNGHLEELFDQWLIANYPDRRDKVMRQIAEMHGGQVHDTRSTVRMRGEGTMAEQLRQTFALAKRKFMPETKRPAFNSSLFRRIEGGQQSLF
jgi:DNA repair photolyase